MSVQRAQDPLDVALGRRSSWIGAERAAGRVEAEQWVGVAVEAGELGIVAPLLLHELELAVDVGVEAQELQAARWPLVRPPQPSLAFSISSGTSIESTNGGAIRAPAADDAMQVRELQRFFRGVAELPVARIGAADVCTEGAARAVAIVVLIVREVGEIARRRPRGRLLALCAGTGRAATPLGQRPTILLAPVTPSRLPACPAQ